MIMRAAVLTALMDDYDTLKPVLPQDGAEVDWICLTDSKELAAEAVEADNGATVHPTGWEIIYHDRPADEHPNRAAKKPKMHPASFTSASASVWIDASFRVVSPRFVAEALEVAHRSLSGVAQFAHPWRSDLFDEAKVSFDLPKYSGEKAKIREQVVSYERAGMPRNWGLWATGVIARRHDDAVLRWGDFWAGQIRAYSYQDQISHPYACWAAGVRPANLPGDHFHNPWLAYEGSARHG